MLKSINNNPVNRFLSKEQMDFLKEEGFVEEDHFNGVKNLLPPCKGVCNSSYCYGKPIIRNALNGYYFICYVGERGISLYKHSKNPSSEYLDHLDFKYEDYGDSTERGFELAYNEMGEKLLNLLY